MQSTTRSPETVAHSLSTTQILERYREVRGWSARLTDPLTPEDTVVQSMPDVSSTKWHLAHTSWFFETFVLKAAGGYRPFNARFEYLFNSYYNAVGPQFSRPHRGLISRPTLAEVKAYRAYVDEHMERLLESGGAADLLSVVEIGLHHEQQHQELILTDIKHVLSCNPLFPVYRERREIPEGSAPGEMGWREFPEGLRTIGHEGEGFHFDNEGPRHRVFLQPFALATRLVTNAEYRAFVDDGGYQRPEHWLSDGWATVQSQGWERPFYWLEIEGTMHEFTLSGMRPLAPNEPVTHLSYFEADAYARWAGARLPRETEWETAAEGAAMIGNFVESEAYHPVPVKDSDDSHMRQLFGDVWEWTASAYDAYPGYAPAPGALGEYNGKFMCNQFVLRGGSCATSRTHIRRTYRNFFPPAARWQFSGLRLAKDAS
ncbi:MAG: ergothioneine biosynthesis protein EgtB [Deltaproteobacteria bacterium]|nr:ergothioneine biosynthesis protein EgtB [Deltaproteobacteria bacterium]